MWRKGANKFSRYNFIEHARRRSISCDHRLPLLKALRLDHSDIFMRSIQWRHHERDGVSNHRGLDCLLSRFLMAQIKQTSKLGVPDLREGNPPVTGVFPHRRPVAENDVFIWWRHQDAFIALWYRFVFSQIFSEGSPEIAHMTTVTAGQTETVDWSWPHGNTSQ